jgi:hypothetical protein
MKKAVFIFVPVKVARKRSPKKHVVWTFHLPDVEDDWDELVADERGAYPDWTAFLPNPRPPATTREP